MHVHVLLDQRQPTRGKSILIIGRKDTDDRQTRGSFLRFPCEGKAAPPKPKMYLHM